MVRARWASVIATASLGLSSGCCCCWDDCWFSGRGCCVPDCGCEVEVAPLCEGPYLGGYPAAPLAPLNGGTTITPPVPQNGVPTLAPPPRLVPQPLAQPTPFTPSSIQR